MDARSVSIAVRVDLAMSSMSCWENIEGWLICACVVLFLPNALLIRSRSLFLTSSGTFVSGVKANACLLFLLLVSFRHAIAAQFIVAVRSLLSSTDLLFQYVSRFLMTSIGVQPCTIACLASFAGRRANLGTGVLFRFTCCPVPLKNSPFWLSVKNFAIAPWSMISIGRATFFHSK